MMRALQKGQARYVPVTVAQLSGGGGDFVAVIPAAVVAANKTFLDIFSQQPGVYVTVTSVCPRAIGSAAVTGVLTVDLTARRTTAIGTGGTPVIPVKLDTALPALPAGITLRAAPTGGATAAGDVGLASLATEETGPGPNLSALMNLLVAPVVLRPGEGLAVVQGAVASVGSIGFVVAFSVDKA